jgi:HSP90 family molecular chaperone
MPSLCVCSDGSYEIAEAEGVKRGTKIVIALNDNSKEFAQPKTLKGMCAMVDELIALY